MALEKATITNLETNERFTVMFNPEEYTLDLGNIFAEIGIPGLRTPPVQYVRGNSRTLKMELFFDTYEEKTDVRIPVGELAFLLEKNDKTQAPPVLLFSWGTLNFKCVLESAGQKYTMFLDDGTPVRARVTVSFKEYEAVEIKIESGVFIGPPMVLDIVEGDTVSKIAGDVLGDPGAWRDVAKENDIDNPRKLKAGDSLLVPSAGKKSQG